MERSGDLTGSAWRCGRLRATTFLDPSEALAPIPAPRAPTTTTRYAASVIASLTAERDTERRAHERTATVAKNTIAVLEAQLALREAELESCLGHVPSLEEEEEEEGEEEEEEEPGGMSDGEALRVLELSALRRRRIEMETRDLSAKLESLRSRAAPSPPPPPAPPDLDLNLQSPIDALNAQIQQFAALIDSFRAERQRLREMIELDSSAGSLPPPPPPREKNLLEAEEDEIPMGLATPLFPTTLYPYPDHDPPLPPRTPPETNTPLAETDPLCDLRFS